MKTKFSVGQVWETNKDSERGAGRFTIIGPPNHHNPKTWKLCRFEYVSQYWNSKYPPFEQDYSHEHLKRYAKLIESA